MQNSTQTKTKNTNEWKILLKYKPFAHYAQHTHTHQMRKDPLQLGQEVQQ